MLGADEVAALLRRHRELLDLAAALAASISFDDGGALVGREWRGGNGGLMSRETIKGADLLRAKVDQCRRELALLLEAGGAA
ncbi:MAG: hypothetical protein P4M09_29740 [Devosia sp.]|nr:hypothetical protein [Devosia sp.]